jgi:hypothetical protein
MENLKSLGNLRNFYYVQAQEWAGVSGILTVMILGMFFAAFARTAFKGDSHQSLHHFWEMAAYIANTLVFMLRYELSGKIRKQKFTGYFTNKILQTMF